MSGPSADDDNGTILTLIEVLQDSDDHVDNEDRSTSAEGKEKLFLFVIKLINEESLTHLYAAKLATVDGTCLNR